MINQSIAKNIRLFLVKQKLFFNRGYGLIGCLGIGYLVAAKLQEQLIAYYQFRMSLFVMFPIGVLGVWLVGWLEYKLGFWQTESEFAWSINPAYKKLSDGIKKTEQSN